MMTMMTIIMIMIGVAIFFLNETAEIIEGLRERTE